VPGGVCCVMHSSDLATLLPVGPRHWNWKGGTHSKYVTLKERQTAWRARWERMRAERAAERAAKD
jgi:hypothetical protein